MLNRKKPDDFVISTGKHYSVRDFKISFELVDLDYKKYKNWKTTISTIRSWKFTRWL